MRLFILEFGAVMNSLLELFLFSLGRNSGENEKGDLNFLYWDLSSREFIKNRLQTIGSVVIFATR